MKSKKEKKEMEDFSIPYDGIIKANQIKFILSSKLYNKNKDQIENEKKKNY